MQTSVVPLYLVKSGFDYRIKAERGCLLMNIRKVFRFELHISDTCG